MRDPLLGGLFENIVVIESIKARLNKGLEPNLYFFRDNNKNEVDLLFATHEGLVPIEIKAAMTYNNNFGKGIRHFQRNNKKAIKGYLLYGGNLSLTTENYTVLNFNDTSNIFEPANKPI